MGDDRVKRKIEETTALQIARRDRGGVHDRMGLSTRGTFSPFVEAQMVEQPPPVEPGAERDVIVQPTTPPDMGGAMQPPEEPLVPEEEPADEEPEVDVDEEMKRTLFNTLSELIDLGRIGRNEQEIRKYVEDHEDEIGELIDVLDDVVDMLIGEGSVLREPKTFDIGDEEEPPTQGGDFDEMKPGVGGQVPQGGTTTTIIASDRSGGNGGALHESIMTGITSGADIDLTLERAAGELKEETLEYGFDSPEDLDHALKVLDGLGLATTNVMKIGPTTLNIVRDDRNKEDVDKQIASIRAAGIELKEPVADDYGRTPATLVSGPNVGQGSTVRSEGVFSDWYHASKGESPGFVDVHSYGVDKKAAQASVAGADPKYQARLVRASSDADAIAKYKRRTAEIRSPEARQARAQRGVGALKTVGRAAAAPWKAAGEMAGRGVGALIKALRPASGEERPEGPAPAEPAAAPEPTGLAGPGVRRPEDAVKITVEDPTKYVSVLKQLEGNPGVSYASGDGQSIWVASDDPDIKAALTQMAGEVSEGLQSWKRPVMRVRAAMGEGVDPVEFGSVGEAEEYARDIHDLGYRGVVLEDLNITRTGMAVEVVFGNKGQAASAQGALLQYKGIDTVKDAGNGTLVVFTTDADPEEARNRVTTILQNARVPMESFKVSRYRRAVLEANPGGQSAIGGPVPGISRAYNGPDEMPTPLPTTGGMKGSSIEAEEKCPHCGGAYDEKGICVSCRRIRKMPDKVDYRTGPRGGGLKGPTEQAGDQDPETRRRYMQPFYAPEDAGLPPGPEMDALPGPGEPGYEPPEYAREPGEPPEPGGEPEAAVVGEIWRLDVPEEPEEKSRLTDVLNQAKEDGVLASWTEIGAPEEPEAEFEPGAEVPPEAGVDLDVAPEFAANVPTATTPPIGEQAVGDERGYDLPPEEPPAVADAAPGEVPVDELPPEEPEEEEHYIAVEFAAETEQEERERFPDWIADITADPETGEGGVVVAGWRPEEPSEEIPGEPGEEIPGEIPGEIPEISPELSPEFSEQSVPVVRGSPSDEVPVPEDRILGESAGHLRNIFNAVRRAAGRGDEAGRKRFAEALVRHGRALRISRGAMARILRENEGNLDGVYPELETTRRPVVEGGTSGDRIVLPTGLVELRENHRAMVGDGDEAGARRVLNELRFQAEACGVDVRDVVSEQGKYPVAVKHMNAHGTYQGEHVVVRGFYKYEDGSSTAQIARAGRMTEVPADEVDLGSDEAAKPGWAASTEPLRVEAPAAGVG